MSECVVRMEMPKNCWVCPFGLDGYIWNENDARTHYVRFCSRHSGEEFHVLEADTIDRPWFCDSFICQLPECHGRLVDMKDVEGMFEAAQIISDDDCNCGYVTDDLRIEELPTILPAERSET